MILLFSILKITTGHLYIRYLKSFMEYTVAIIGDLNENFRNSRFSKNQNKKFYS